MSIPVASIAQMAPTNMPLARGRNQAIIASERPTNSATLMTTGSGAVHFHRERETDHDMPDDQDRQPSRPVVGADMIQLLVAFGAGIDRLEVSAEEPATAAIRTARASAAKHRR